MIGRCLAALLSPLANAMLTSSLRYYVQLTIKQRVALSELRADLARKDAILGDLHREIRNYRERTREQGS